MRHRTLAVHVINRLAYHQNRCFADQAACFFFKDTATTEIYTLSLHDALPIWVRQAVTRAIADKARTIRIPVHMVEKLNRVGHRSEEHTSELQSPCNLVCR